MYEQIINRVYYLFLYNMARYARYDKKPSFEGFKPFGGWTYPAMKQFWGGVIVSGRCFVVIHVTDGDSVCKQPKEEDKAVYLFFGSKKATGRIHWSMCVASYPL